MEAIAPAVSTGRGDVGDYCDCMTILPAAIRMTNEMRLIAGSVPGHLADALYETATCALAADAFVLRLPNGIVYYYRRGEGVRIDRPTHADERDVTLFLNGSVFAAVALLNGLVPLHASAVAHEGRVHAFTGVSGAGKSTLVAALVQRGFTLHADDVLVLVPVGDGPLPCLPGHKRIKLWQDALSLTGAAPGERVREALDKYYTEPADAVSTEPLPLASLFFLEQRSDSLPKLTPIRGADLMEKLPSALYRPGFYGALAQPAGHFRFMTQLAGAVRASIFDRPFRKECFEASIDVIEATILGCHD